MTSPSPSGAPTGMGALLMSVHKKGAADDSGQGADMDQDSAPSSPYEIPAPDGFQPPDGTEPGRKFDVTMKVHMDQNGMICIDSIEGISTGQEADDDETQDEPPEPEDETSQAGEGQPGEQEDDSGPPSVSKSAGKAASNFKAAFKKMRS